MISYSNTPTNIHTPRQALANSNLGGHPDNTHDDAYFIVDT